MRSRDDAHMLKKALVVCGLGILVTAGSLLVSHLGSGDDATIAPIEIGDSYAPKGSRDVHRATRRLRGSRPGGREEPAEQAPTSGRDDTGAVEPVAPAAPLPAGSDDDDDDPPDGPGGTDDDDEAGSDDGGDDSDDD